LSSPSLPPLPTRLPSVLSSSFFLLLFSSSSSSVFFFFFFNDTATTEIYTLSLHDALPISLSLIARTERILVSCRPSLAMAKFGRSEEHTSELQSLTNLVCRLLLEKKKKKPQKIKT